MGIGVGGWSKTYVEHLFGEVGAPLGVEDVELCVLDGSVVAMVLRAYLAVLDPAL